MNFPLSRWSLRPVGGLMGKPTSLSSGGGEFESYQDCEFLSTGNTYFLSLNGLYAAELPAKAP